MIPEAEIQAYFAAFTRALSLAADGEVDEGLTCLLEGWWRAQNAMGKGEPWGEELMSRYQQAMDNFKQTYGSGGQ